MSASYLHTVLLDGAKPFLYRNGVRSLLGVPEGDGGEILFSSAVQPVGFAYANPQFMGEPHISPYRPDLAANPAFVRQFTPLQDQARKSSESYAGAEASGEHRVMPQGMAQQNTIGPAQEPDTSVTKSSDASQGPAPVIEKATLHVPDAPERRQDVFPATAHQFSPLQASPRKSTDSHAGVEGSGEHRVVPKGMARQNVTGRVPEQETSGTKPSDASQGPAPVIEKATLHVPNAPQRNNNSSTLSFSGQRHHLSGKAEEEFQHALPSKQSRPTSITRELSDTPSINATHSLETLAQMNSRTGHGLNRAADRIEQLRTAVRELAMKQSSSREQTRGDEAHPQQHQAPAPAQRIIVVKQPSTQAKIPYAFLERSYLSRFRVRNLR
ncbi:MAG TPA: hypothetical protein PKD12_02160 [Nitrospira sp.]|nr:hypothetical protein [Nitrospira sp.]